MLILIIIFILIIYIHTSYSVKDPIIYLDLPKNIFPDNNYFNPSIMFNINGLYTNVLENFDNNANFIMSFRSASSTSGKSSLYIKKNNQLFYKNNKLVFNLDPENSLYGRKDSNIEDSRFFILDNNLWLVYGIYENNSSVRQVISSYTNINDKKFLSGLKPKTFEKNWVFFIKNNKLYMVYEFHPMLTIYEVDKHYYSCKLIKRKNVHFNNIENTVIRGGTSPIVINDKLYFFGHSNIHGQYYTLALIILDYNTLEIIEYSNNLLTSTHLKYPIIFCRGALYIKPINTFVISVGINDSTIRFYELTMEEIKSKLIKY